MAGYHVAVVGATGAVGQTVLRVLEERAFPVASLRVTATERSAGRPVSFRGEAHTVVETSQDALRGVQIAFFGGGDGASERFARRAAASGSPKLARRSAAAEGAGGRSASRTLADGSWVRQASCAARASASASHSPAGSALSGRSSRVMQRGARSRIPRRPPAARCK